MNPAQSWEKGAQRKGCGTHLRGRADSEDCCTLCVGQEGGVKAREETHSQKEGPQKEGAGDRRVLSASDPWCLRCQQNRLRAQPEIQSWGVDDKGWAPKRQTQWEKRG